MNGMVVTPEDWENSETYKGALELSKAMRSGFAPLLNALDTLDAAAANVRGSENVYALGANLARVQIAIDKAACAFNRLHEMQTAIEKALGDDKCDFFVLEK